MAAGQWLAAGRPRRRRPPPLPPQHRGGRGRGGAGGCCCTTQPAAAAVLPGSPGCAECCGTESAKPQVRVGRSSEWLPWLRSARCWTQSNLTNVWLLWFAVNWLDWRGHSPPSVAAVQRRRYAALTPSQATAAACRACFGTDSPTSCSKATLARNGDRQLPGCCRPTRPVRGPAVWGRGQGAGAASEQWCRAVDPRWARRLDHTARRGGGQVHRRAAGAGGSGGAAGCCPGGLGSCRTSGALLQRLPTRLLQTTYPHQGLHGALRSSPVRCRRLLQRSFT